MIPCQVLNNTGRTVVLSAQPTMLRGVTVLAPPLPTWSPKDPTSTDFFTVDFSRLVAGRTIGDVLSAASAGVDIIGYMVAGSLVTFILGGGQDGQTAQIQMRAICGHTDIPAVVLLPIASIITLTLGEPDMPWTRAVTTVGTSPSSTEALPIFGATGATVTIRGLCVLRNAATGDSISFDFAADVTGYGTPQATVPLQGDPVYRGSTALEGCTVTVSANGSTIVCIVTGIAGVTLFGTVSANWAAA